MRKILHLDLDCFYAAVEEKHNPRLKGQAVAVGGSPEGRGVVCTANYEARKFGVRAAIPSSRAMRLCPHLILVRPNFDLYRQESQFIRQIFERYTKKIQPLSLDEAYLDVTEVAQNPGEATRIAREIKRAVFEERALRISAGVAPNKFLAKIASDWKKPDGLFVIPPEKIDEFILNLKVEKIYGVGKVTAEKMHAQGIFTCADLQRKSLHELARIFGSRAQDYFDLSRGRDDRPVHDDGERKSLTVEETFSEDRVNWEQIRREIPLLYDDWLLRMQSQGLQDKVIGAVVKLKFSDFKSTTHEKSSREFPSILDFENLAHQAWIRREEPIRLLGLGARLLAAEEPDERQLSLLTPESA